VNARQSTWVTPLPGTSWLFPGSSSWYFAPNGMYAYQKDIGAYSTGETWTLFGSLAADDRVVSAFLVGDDDSYVRINGIFLGKTVKKVLTRMLPTTFGLVWDRVRFLHVRT